MKPLSYHKLMIKQFLHFIEDDGVGMTEEEITKAFLEKSSDKSSGYGIKNINERFKMNYGNDYGLVFYSEKGKGTKVDIIIPLVL